MDFISTQKFELTSPRKLREASYLIKKMTPMEAIERLPYLPKRAGTALRKVIMTAVANAKQKEISGDKLIFKEIQIGEGPMLKRFRAGARGRAKPYKRRMSHIRVVLSVKEEKVVRSEKAVNQKSVKPKKKTNTDKKSQKVRSQKMVKSTKQNKSKKGDKK